MHTNIVFQFYFRIIGIKDSHSIEMTFYFYRPAYVSSYPGFARGYAGHDRLLTMAGSFRIAFQSLSLRLLLFAFSYGHAS
jgi:hypothetical protein